MLVITVICEAIGVIVLPIGIASIPATTGAFSIDALAMARGIGFGSTMAACFGALTHAVP